MKKSILFSTIFFLTVSTLIFSCKKNIDKINIIVTNNIEVFAGQTETILILLQPDVINDGEVGELTILEGGNTLFTEAVNSKNTKTISFEYTAPETANDGDEITLTIEVTEKNTGDVTTETITATITKSNAVISIDTYPDASQIQYAEPGDYLYWYIYLYTDNNEISNIGEFKIKEGDTVLYSSDFSNNSNSTEYIDFDYTVPNDAQGGEQIIFTLEATDAYSGNVTTETLTIEIEASPTLIESTFSLEYSSTTLTNTMMLVCDPSGISVAGGSSTEGDLAFVWNNIYGYSIVSPDAYWIAELYSYNGITYTTSDKKNTKIQQYTGSYSWSDLNATRIEDLYIYSSTITGGGNGVQGVNTGNILAFETEDGRKGVFLVTSNNKVTKLMSAEVKYQASSN